MKKIRIITAIALAGLCITAVLLILNGEKAASEWLVRIAAVIFVITFGFGLGRKKNKLTADGKYTEVSLDFTEEQKLSDLEYLYRTAFLGKPSMTEFEKLYGVSYEEIYRDYIEKVRKTKNSYELYCILASFMSLSPGMHNGLIFPNYARLSDYRYILGYEGSASEEIKNYVYSWEKEIKKSLPDYGGKGCMFSYSGGAYIYNQKTGFFGDEFIGAQLVSLNGTAVDDMMFRLTSCREVYYDGINKKPFRIALMFNDRTGDEYDAEIRLASGELVTKKLYSGVFFDISYNYGGAAAQHDDMPQCEKETDRHYIIHRDSSRGLVYVNIWRLSDHEHGEMLKDELLGVLADTDRIVLDLSEFGGGEWACFENYLYPVLFEKNLYAEVDVSVKMSEYVKNAFADRGCELNESASYRIIFRSDGKAAVKREIYILTSFHTYGNADAFVRLVKDYENVTVIGSRTGGEGICGHTVMAALPESRLSFWFMPSRNAEGEDNSVYGTEPHFHVGEERDTFSKRRQVISEGKYPYYYENRLSWDNVLNKTLEIMDSKKG